MASPLSAYWAGVGTVVIALTAGFSGGVETAGDCTVGAAAQFVWGRMGPGTVAALTSGSGVVEA